jgi:hypothetical protein
MELPVARGHALEERNVRHVFTRMLEKAELGRIREHDLRRDPCARFAQTSVQ